jgi:hypothetical protein
MNTCLSCDTPEVKKPLLSLNFQGEEIYICPQCLPVLIHDPAKLADRLPGAADFGKPLEHHH